MIEVKERIEVPSAPRTVWSVLSDPHEVVGCVPGAALDRALHQGCYEGEGWRVRPEAKLLSDLGDWLAPENVELTFGS